MGTSENISLPSYLRLVAEATRRWEHLNHHRNEEH
jgi:hypothetical protein